MFIFFGHRSASTDCQPAGPSCMHNQHRWNLQKFNFALFGAPNVFSLPFFLSLRSTELLLYVGSGCGAVGRAVASGTRDPRSNPVIGIFICYQLY